MIYSLCMNGEPPEMFTVVQDKQSGMHVSVGMTEEELFRKVLGDKEFEKRVAKSVERDMADMARSIEANRIARATKPPRWWEIWK